MISLLAFLSKYSISEGQSVGREEWGWGKVGSAEMNLEPSFSEKELEIRMPYAFIVLFWI